MVDKIWEQSSDFMAVDKLPSWPCPTCNSGILVLQRKSLRFRESARQFDVEEFGGEDFESNMILGILRFVGKATLMMMVRQARFHAFLLCNDKSCKEVVTVCGRAKVPSALQKSRVTESQSHFILPEYFSPPLLIFSLPPEYPQEVRMELVKSFSIFFADTSAAANKLRIAVERIMDVIGIPPGGLAPRLRAFKELNHELGEMLLSVKWLGDKASHSTGLSKKKILDAYEITEYVMKQLFIQPEELKKMRKLSKNLK